MQDNLRFGPFYFLLPARTQSWRDIRCETMGLLSIFKSRDTTPPGGWPAIASETRAISQGGGSLQNPQPWVLSMFGVSQSNTGIYVSEETSLRLSAVFACTKILSESVAVPSLKLFRRRKSGGQDEATDHPLYGVVHDSFNDDTTSFRGRELLQKKLSLNGNAYARVNRRGNGKVESLDLFDSRSTVSPFRLESGRPAYRIQHYAGGQEILLGRAGEILHLRGYPSDDGLTGLSPIGYAREAVGLGLAAEEYGARFFGGSGVNNTYIKHPGSLGPQAKKNIEGSLTQWYAGLSNAHKFMLLEEGMEMVNLSVPWKDLQFIELRKFQTEEIARIYRIPMHLLQNLDRATFNNLEHQSLEFIMYTMLPWFERWEDDLNLQLLTPSERADYFFKFRIDDLLRGDALTQAQALAIERQNGVINANEWRTAKGRNPREDADGEKYWEPLNMGTGGAANPGALQQKEPMPT